MKKTSLAQQKLKPRWPTSKLLACTATLIAGCVVGLARGDEIVSPVAFPTGYEKGIHYATVNRGNIREELYTSKEAIEAARKNQLLPVGTVIMMEDYRDGSLFRYIAMAKIDNYGKTQPEDIRNGDWAYQSFAPDGSVNHSENVTRCMACHKSQKESDYVFSYGRMQTFNKQ